MSGKWICGITDPWTAFPWWSPVASQAHRGGTITEAISHKAGKHLCVRQRGGKKNEDTSQGKNWGGRLRWKWRWHYGGGGGCRGREGTKAHTRMKRELCSNGPVNSWHWQIDHCSDVCSVIRDGVEAENDGIKKNTQEPGINRRSADLHLEVLMKNLWSAPQSRSVSLTIVVCVIIFLWYEKRCSTP